MYNLKSEWHCCYSVTVVDIMVFNIFFSSIYCLNKHAFYNLY